MRNVLTYLVLFICYNFTMAHPTSQPADTQPASQPSLSLPEQLQEVSVTVKGGTAEGSGVVKTRKGINFVWTAAHVVADLRTTRRVIDPKTGTERTIVEFKDAKILKNLYDKGRKVGQVEMLARVIRYSDATNGQDLALLQVYKERFVQASAQFLLDGDVPTVGTELYHVGSLRGEFGSNSVTDGIVSQFGRVISGKVFDQTTVTAFPGSSGGGVFNKKTGKYVGMVVRGAGETFILMVPIRRIVRWAERAGVMFALNDKIPMPEIDKLKQLPIEDVGKEFESKAVSNYGSLGDYPYLIRYVETNAE